MCVCVLWEELFSGCSWCHCWMNGCSVLCASKELWIKMYAHSVRIDKIWSNFIGWVWYIKMYLLSSPIFGASTSPYHSNLYRYLKFWRLVCSWGPKCCSKSPLKVLDLIVNFCKRQLIVSAIFLFRCTSDL